MLVLLRTASSLFNGVLFILSLLVIKATLLVSAILIYVLNEGRMGRVRQTERRTSLIGLQRTLFIHKPNNELGSRSVQTRVLPVVRTCTR
jgi:hypothetical protein